jgi:RNA polymerase sigma factor (sigma-70 family)
MPGLRGPSALLRLQSDERLIALTRKGQPAAFETLCTRYQSRLLSFCRHMLASREDAEDVLQEVFAAAFNPVLADEREINVRPWLYRIARNRSLNHLRRTAAIGVDSMDVHYAEHGISTGDKVLRRESFRELIGDVHELPETQRTALLLREIDALSYDQIAQAMETTVPSVKSLLVRARISLAEAAEARKLSCEEVRLELGEVAEGLTKLSTSARRHVRSCERCLSFKKHLRENNRALAAIMPVAPLFLLKKVLLAKLGSTASAGGAHAAGAGATVGATATATVGAGAAAGGGGLASGLVTAGAGALATKAVAGLAAAAIVTAGAVAADHAVVVHHHHRLPVASASSVPADHYASAPTVVRELAQPSSPGASAGRHAATVALRTRRTHHPVKPVTPSAGAAVVPAVATSPVTSAPAPAAPPAKPSDPQSTTQVTEVTTETTELPATATTGTGAPATPPPTPSPTPSEPTSTTPPPTTTPTPTPTPPVSTPVEATGSVPATQEPSTTPQTQPPVEVVTVPKAPVVRHVPDTGGTPAPATQRLPLGVWNGRRGANRR